MMIPIVPDGSDPRNSKSAAQLLREVAAADPTAHSRALARGYGIGGRLATLYLTLEEIDAIAIHLALAVDVTQVAHDAQEASRIIWNAPDASLVLRSLATMFAELREQLTIMDKSD